MSLEDLITQADFVTVHLPKTPDTVGIIGRDLLAKAKPGLRIINTARGGIVDEEALADAVRSGQVQGAGLDVFAKEPTTESPLFELPSVIVTPHLGASTVEAQDKAGVTIGEMVVLALAGDFVPFAVNVAASEVSETVRPFMPLAEQLGRIFACLNDGLPDKLEVEYQGGLAGTGTSILTLSVLKGLFAAGTEEPVSYVNAPQLAEERGLVIREVSTTKSQDYVNLITLRSSDHTVAGTLTGPKTEPRVVMVDDHAVEVPPSPHMLVVRNDDHPGMIGAVGTELGASGVSISFMTVGPSAHGNTAAHGALHRSTGPRRDIRAAAGGRRDPRHSPGDRQRLGAFCRDAFRRDVFRRGLHDRRPAVGATGEAPGGRHLAPPCRPGDRDRPDRGDGETYFAGLGHWLRVLAWVMAEPRCLTWRAKSATMST